MSRNRDFGAAASSLAAPSSSYNGYAHVVDTTQASGWNLAPYNNFNFLINGGADHWQRGTTWTADNKFLADRWYWTGTNGGGQSTDVPSGVGLTYSMSFTGTNTAYPRLAYYMPANEATFLAGKTVTMSFWAKNISGTAVLYTEQQTPQTPGVFNSSVSSFTSKVHANAGAMSTSWQYYTWTFVINALAATNGATFNIVRSTESASSTLVTGIKLELGSVATPFTRNGGDLAGELLKCQKYYEKSYSQNEAVGAASSLGSGTIGNITTSTVGNNVAGNIAGINMLPFKVTKRITPIVTTYDYDGTANAVRLYPADAKKTGVTGLSNIKDSGSFQFMSFSATPTAISSGNNVMFHWTADAEVL